MSLASLEWGRAASGGRKRGFKGFVVDVPLLVILLAIVALGMVVLYSAVSADTGLLVRQGMRFGVGLAAFFVIAQIPPHYLRIFTPWMYLLGIGLLLAVAVEGQIGKGAQRWLDLGVVTFQPSELLKLAVPMMCAWFMHERRLPPTFAQLVVMGLIVLTPAFLIAEQPDLGTALLVMAGGAPDDSARRHQRARDAGVRRARSRGLAGALGGHARLSEGACVHVLESRVRSARHGLQHHSIEDRDRLGRPVRQGLVERHAVAPRVPAGALDGLHLRGHGGGVRLARLVPAARAVSRARRPRSRTSRPKRRTRSAGCSPAH